MFWDWYYTNYLQVLIGGDSFNPFMVTMIPPQMKSSNRLQFPAHLSLLRPGPRVPWQIRKDKGEEKKRVQRKNEDASVSPRIFDITGRLCCLDSTIYLFFSVCLFLLLFNWKSFWKRLNNHFCSLSFFFFSSLQLSSVTPSFISWKKIVLQALLKDF